MINYFLYARKSTDVEDKQVRSIEDQLSVLRALAKEHGLNIVEEFIEKQSAKVPGRPIFNEMLARIERGNAQGIICWKLDRLARNPIDGGQISWFLQKGKIQHIRTHDQSYRPTDNILMMSVEFGMANQYIIDLATNTRRGLIEKAKRGDYPGLAPIGYLNDLRTKLVGVDNKEAEVVRRAFEQYAEGNWRLEDVSNFLASEGIKTKGGRPIRRDQASYMLSNPFYVGLFRYAGELHEGNHEPIISKQLFDKVQKALKARQKPQKSHTNNPPQAFCGFIRCGACKMMITGEHKTKRQKNGNVHEYTYYRCTKKSKIIRCTEPQIREEELNKQLSAIIKGYAMPPEWAVELHKMADKDEQEVIRSTGFHVQALRDEIKDVSQKLQRLVSAYLDQDIEREAYRSEKAILLSKKKSLEEKIGQLGRGSIAWLEPLRNWINDAQTLNEINETTPVPLKKSFAQKIFGSNLFLKNQKIEFIAQTQYAAVRAAYGKNGNFPASCIVVPRARVELATQGSSEPFYLNCSKDRTIS